MLSRIIGWVLVVFVVYYLVTDPDGAARFVHSVLNGLRDAGDSLSRFVNRL